jgi:hypothetical protein
MNVLYPSCISVHRSRTDATGDTNSISAVGLSSYSGRQASTNKADPEGENILFTNIPAQIVARHPGRARNTEIPSDISERPQWVIYIPPGIPPNGLPQFSIRDRDTIVDNEGYRYGVAQAYWNPMGYALGCFRLEV